MSRAYKKRVFIVHGWGGAPNEDWLPWLKEELEKKDFKVHVLKMPKTMEPHIRTWVPHLHKQVGNPNKNTFFVGHSMGCQTILRYLQSLPEDAEVGGVVLVGGFIHLTSRILKTNKDKEIAEPWLTKPLSWDKMMKHTKNFITIFSDNDPFVPLNDFKMFNKNLGAKVVIEHEMGHMAMDDGVFRIPDVLNAVLGMSRNRN